MSSIGTGIAAGVAQTSHQATQVAKRRDKRVHEQQRAAQRTREVFDIHLETLEENEQTNTQARLRADAQMHTPEHASERTGHVLVVVEHARERPRRRRAQSDAFRPGSPPRWPGPGVSLGPQAGPTQVYEQAEHAGEAPTREADDGRRHLDVQG